MNAFFCVFLNQYDFLCNRELLPLKNQSISMYPSLNMAQSHLMGWTSVIDSRLLNVVPAAQFSVVNIKWLTPPHFWIKFNVDGSVKDQSACCAGVFRDHWDQWKSGFIHNLGSSNVLIAE